MLLSEMTRQKRMETKFQIRVKWEVMLRAGEFMNIISIHGDEAKDSCEVRMS